MPQYAIDVVVSPSAPVVDVTAVGVQGPPGVPGPPGPAGEPGPAGPAGTGNVTGPASATDNSLALFDGATGKLLDAGPDGRISGSLAIGTTPAQSGAVRLGHDEKIQARSSDNTADKRLLWHSFQTTHIGGDTTFTTLYDPFVQFNGSTVYGIGSIAVGREVNLKETTAPAVPAANEANLWLEDNGAGKSRLMVQFATGAAVQIAIQP